MNASKPRQKESAQPVAVMIFPSAATPEQIAPLARDALARIAIKGSQEPASKLEPRDESIAPLWTWFIENPRG